MIIEIVIMIRIIIIKKIMDSIIIIFIAFLTIMIINIIGLSYT